ncbi:MAG: hypothetical protein ACREC4_04670 [Methylocella sp.]
MSLLKTVPAVIGIAGLLTFFGRARKPESELELVNIVQRVRDTFLLLGCAALIVLSVWLIRRPAPPDHDIVSPLANVSTMTVERFCAKAEPLVKPPDLAFAEMA